MENLKLLIDQQEVNCWQYGDKSNPVLVCFHGLAGSGLYSFSGLIPLLEKQFYLIVLDSPGHGKTGPFEKEEAYFFSNLAVWFDRVLQQLSDKPFFVMGHSWGADAALHFARHYPKKVLGIILLDGGFTFPQNQPEMTFDYTLSGWNNYMDHSSFRTWAEVSEEYKHYTKKWNAVKENGVKTIFHQNEKGEFELLASKFTVLSIIKAFFQEPFTEVYPLISMPLLLVYGDSPQELKAARTLGISQLKAAVKDLTVQKIEGAGHMLQWDEPAEVAAAVSKWLAQKLISTAKA
ncbi:alpha/beta hydrolase [Planococcus shenhongbingii]|uniref:alpha/beta fold hydrolase n=1 Tax=Planococcus shenhongbingii TaxID=3058398 RepID=UPI002620DEDA|nr:alpha/beta hydrolase [Planococcus sp. N016]WKA58445.1 alpha/beta hydrolase [Planococcus sp. N016]